MHTSNGHMPAAAWGAGIQFLEMWKFLAKADKIFELSYTEVLYGQ